MARIAFRYHGMNGTDEARGPIYTLDDETNMITWDGCDAPVAYTSPVVDHYLRTGIWQPLPLPAHLILTEGL